MSQVLHRSTSTSPLPPCQSAPFGKRRQVCMVKPIGRNQQMARSRTSQVDEPPLNRSGNEAGQPSDGDTEMPSSPSNGSYAKGAPVAFPEDELWSFKTVVVGWLASESSVVPRAILDMFLPRSDPVAVPDPGPRNHLDPGYRTSVTPCRTQFCTSPCFAPKEYKGQLRKQARTAIERLLGVHYLRFPRSQSRA